jgi:multiphosphoryl transfer protein
MAHLIIRAPLSGQIWPLERVPDAVFAQKLVGDGVSIDPTDMLLVAACDGEVVSLHSAGHALTLRTPAGLDVLMHIGIDTVTLKGEGFQPRVKTPRYGSRGRRSSTSTSIASPLMRRAC